MDFLIAHVKWFVPVEEIIEQETIGFSLSDPVVLAWFGIIVLALGIAFLLEKHLPEPSKLIEWGEQNKRLTFKLFQGLLGIFFLITAYESVIIAPIFEVNDTWTRIMHVITITLGVLFVFDVKAWIAGAGLMLLGLIASFYYGFVEIFDHLHLLGIAIFLLIRMNPKKSIRKRYKDWAIPGLRVLTGLALVVLAFSEKLLHPELGLEFLKTHEWNFVSSLGVEWFDNYVFVISAGAVELLLGLLLVFGLVTRLTTIAVALFMLATACVLGIHEVIGHLPVFAIGILLIVYGSGDRLKLTRLLKKS